MVWLMLFAGYFLPILFIWWALKGENTAASFIFTYIPFVNWILAAGLAMMIAEDAWHDFQVWWRKG